MKKLFNPSFHPDRLDLVLLFARIAIGCFMLVHGLPKLDKLMAGGEIQFADPIGLGEKTSLILVVFAEVVCSILLILGFATRFALAALIFTMVVVVFITHSLDPFDVKEKPLLYLVVYCIFFISGSGRYSVDHLLYNRLNK